MLNSQIFEMVYPAGMTLSSEQGNIYCFDNIGQISGKKATIRAITTTNMTERDDWYVFNVLNKNGFFKFAVAVCGVVSADSGAVLVERYFAQFDQVLFVGGFTADTLRHFLNKDNATYKQLTVQSISRYINDVTDNVVVWEDDVLLSHNGSFVSLLHDLERNDSQELMFDSMSDADFADFVLNLQDDMLDALIVKNGEMDKFVATLGRAISSVSSDTLSATNVTQSQPFKSNGATNVAVNIEFSDGQTVAIVFHNNDTTPSKLGITDILTSWKFMLNKRDVTAVLQPDSQKSSTPKQLATRMFKLVEKNSAKFTKNNQKKAENEQKLLAMRDEVEKKTQALNDLDTRKQSLQAEYDELLKNPQSIQKNNENGIDDVTLNQDAGSNEVKPIDIPKKYLDEFHNIVEIGAGYFLAKITEEDEVFKNVKARLDLSGLSISEGDRLSVAGSYLLKTFPFLAQGVDKTLESNGAYNTLSTAKRYIKEFKQMINHMYSDLRWEGLKGQGRIVRNKGYYAHYTPSNELVYIGDSDKVEAYVEQDRPEYHEKIAQEKSRIDDIKNQYKGRLENSDIEWLENHKQDLSDIFKGRISIIKEHLRKFGFFKDDGNYRMRATLYYPTEVLLHIDGHADFGWWTTYNFDFSNIEGIKDLLDKEPEEVAKEILDIYERIKAVEEQRIKDERERQNEILDEKAKLIEDEVLPAFKGVKDKFEAVRVLADQSQDAKDAGFENNKTFVEHLVEQGYEFSIKKEYSDDYVPVEFRSKFENSGGNYGYVTNHYIAKHANQDKASYELTEEEYRYSSFVSQRLKTSNNKDYTLIAPSNKDDEYVFNALGKPVFLELLKLGYKQDDESYFTFYKEIDGKVETVRITTSEHKSEFGVSVDGIHDGVLVRITDSDTPQLLALEIDSRMQKLVLDYREKQIKLDKELAVMNDRDYLNDIAEKRIPLTVDNMQEVIKKIKDIAKRLDSKYEDELNKAVEVYQEFALSVKVG